MGNSCKLNGFKDNKYILKEDLVDYIKKRTNYKKNHLFDGLFMNLLNPVKLLKLILNTITMER
jgi:hypothetical protein